jgi:signal transduction histidine kinase
MTHTVLSTAEIVDQVGLSARQVRERLAEIQGNMDVRQKSVGSGTVLWVVTSKDVAQPSLGDLDLSDIT